MIKLAALEHLDEARLVLTFNDGSYGIWSAAELLARDTVLTRPLGDRAYFQRAFIEGGALAWPNGLELSPWTLQAELRAAGKLKQARAA